MMPKNPVRRSSEPVNETQDNALASTRLSFCRNLPKLGNVASVVRFRLGAALKDREPLFRGLSRSPRRQTHRSAPPGTFLAFQLEILVSHAGGNTDQNLLAFCRPYTPCSRLRCPETSGCSHSGHRAPLTTPSSRGHGFGDALVAPVHPKQLMLERLHYFVGLLRRCSRKRNPTIVALFLEDAGQQFVRIGLPLGVWRRFEKSVFRQPLFGFGRRRSVKSHQQLDRFLAHARERTARNGAPC